MSQPRGFCAIGLDNAKTPEDVGHTLRACSAYQAAFLAISGTRDVRHATDTPNHYRHMPVLRGDDLLSFLPFDCVPVAIEITDGAQPLPEYAHPERAYYIFGAEDRTLGERILGRCRDKVYIPTRHCLNLAACVNTVLYDRMAKRGPRFDTVSMGTRVAISQLHAQIRATQEI